MKSLALKWGYYNITYSIRFIPLYTIFNQWLKYLKYPA